MEIILNCFGHERPVVGIEMSQILQGVVTWKIKVLVVAVVLPEVNNSYK